MTAWREFSVHINHEAEESVSEIMMDLGAQGVNIVDRSDFETLPQYGFDTLWNLDENKFPKEGVIVKAYFAFDRMNEHFEKQLHQRLEALKSLDLNVSHFTVETVTVKDSDWENKWKEFYSPVQVTRYLTIVPEWESYTKQNEDEQLLVMDPGLAFGTGTHPTTQLSIQALETVMRGNEVVLDVGTGSGVLTIASALLGASDIYAYDVDDIAVQSAKNNIDLNDLPAKITVAENNLLENIEIEADIVVANILANIILLLIPDAMRVLKPGGYFISSGIIAGQKDEMITALVGAGFKIRQVNQMKDWLAIIAQKPGK